MGAETSLRQAVDAALFPYGLKVLGAVNPVEGRYKSLLLIGPDGLRFWQVFQHSAEYLDQTPDPIDRWSTRVLTAIATGFDAEAVFPFGGPPYHPFIAWALASGESFQSPVQILVHAETGLFVSFRGAMGFSTILPSLVAQPSPCESCADKPCLSACPVNALIKDNYDVAACHVYLDTKSGDQCMTRGCAVRRACPVGQTDRSEAQSAFHMSYFHRKAPA